MAKLNELLVIGPARFTEIIQGQIAWNSILNAPTTLSGYGITDVYGKTEIDNKITALNNSIATKVSKSGDTVSGPIDSTYCSTTWANSCINQKSAFNVKGTGYTGWISGNTKNGKAVISTYSNSDDLLYFGWMNNSSTVNSLSNQMTWDGLTGALSATSFRGSGAGLTNLNAGNITSGTFSSDRLPTVPASKGGTGKTNLKDSANVLLNALDTGTSTPADGDYYISQYVNGGTTTTTYHRRPMSSLWNWINSKTINTAVKASQDGNGNVIANTYLARSGGTMTGQIQTSFKGAIAIGSYQAAATTLENLVEELRYSSGCMGSVNLTTAYNNIGTGWYNFLYIPHRSGGMNGSAYGDNCNYGTLLLYGMTLGGQGIHWRIRYASGIQDVQQVVDTNTWRGIQNNLTSDSTTESLSAAMGKKLQNEKMPYSGGKFTGTVKFNETDGSCINFDNGIYINKTGGSTLLGCDGSTSWVGLPTAQLIFRGSGARPTYTTSGTSYELMRTTDAALKLNVRESSYTSTTVGEVWITL